MLFAPCIRASGRLGSKIAFVGEAPGETEELMGVPFVGAAGKEFTDLLQESGIARSACYLTNVLFTRPPGNKLDAFLISKKETPAGYSLSPLSQGKYLHPDLLCELERLREEMQNFQARGGNLVVALGNTALWALTGSGAISASRGTVQVSSLVEGLKVLPTYHPAAVLRNWTWRVIVLQDLEKARREMEFPEVRRTSRRIVINSTLAHYLWLLDSASRCPILSVDIETEKGQITSIAFATSRDIIFVIPFWDKESRDWSYWDEDEECELWDSIYRLLASHPRVLFQNGLYDVQYLWDMLIPIPGFIEDTMILHHSMYPELPKSLGFLGSIYCNDVAWKKMRARHGASETKREE
jgi:uracil-DNA glycosylase